MDYYPDLLEKKLRNELNRNVSKEEVQQIEKIMHFYRFSLSPIFCEVSFETLQIASQFVKHFHWGFTFAYINGAWEDTFLTPDYSQYLCAYSMPVAQKIYLYSPDKHQYLQ